MPHSTRSATHAVAESPETVADLRRTAVELAERAAAHVRARRPEVFGPGTGEGSDSVRTKSHATDPVTVVDTESEELIRELLAAQRPGEAILGEEGGGSSLGADDAVAWVVDPIDGTVNFLYGVPGYAVSVAAMRGGRSVAGAVVDVAHGVTYSAGLGAGATAASTDGAVEHLTCSPAAELDLALVATGFAYGRGRRTRQAEIIGRVLPEIRDIRRFGAAALDLCHVAAGRVDAYFEHGLNPWDWGAGALIAAEAGALLTLPPASHTGAQGDLVVAAAPGIADDLAALLAAAGATEPIPDE
ncbi:inositol monophosphatase family protein [Nocardia shimofusensis]|uniref:inositol monophosphatase family protein n=1 Tax=Nocardia shimofusensis TaxID=228596 RepID=UPI00247FA512|nr:inositol monophosphatase family protein [Nocardia shimofusensis]